MKYDTATPYIASYMLVTNDEGKVAFVMRANTSWMNGYYSLPAGKVENDESYIECALREAKEEVGIEADADDLEHVITVHRRESDSDAMYWVDVYFKVKKWQGEVRNAEPKVHSELAWLDPNDLPDNVIPAVIFAFKQMIAGKNYAEYGWKE